VSGCTNLNTNLQTKKTLKINPNLPVVSSKSVRFISGMDSIALEWKGFNIQNIFGYHIYRSNLEKDSQKMTKIATLKNKYISHYLDKNLEANTNYLYAISIIGSNDTQSQPSEAIKANTLKKLPSVSFSIAINDLPRQVKILWRPHTNQSVEYYIIQRNDSVKTKWSTISKVKYRLNAEYIDTKLKDDYTYSYRIKVLTFDNIMSGPSAPIIAKTKALPKTTSKIDATTNVARKIILTWQPLDNDDIQGYNIYSSKSKTESFSKLASTKKFDNTFEHIINKNNEVRFYKITAVDKDGLETSKQTLPMVTGKTLQSPKPPLMTLGLIQDKTVIINWEKGDNRAIHYNVHKNIKEGMFTSKTKIFKQVDGNRFEDKDILRGVKYEYQVEAVDANGLLSKKTPSVSLTMPRIQIIKNN